MLAIIFGILSMLGYGFSNVIMKYTSSRLDAHDNVFWRGVGVVIIFLVLMPFVHYEWNAQIIFLSLLVAMAAYVPIYAFFKALSTGKVGVIAPIGNSAVIFTVLFSLIFFDEVLPFSQVLAIVVIVLGIVLISLNLRHIRSSDIFRLSSGVPYALVTCLGWGLLFFYMKIPVGIIGPILTSLVIELGPTIIAGLKKPHFPKGLVGYFALMSISGAAGTLFYNMGITLENVSIVAALSFANPIIPVLYSQFVYKEHMSRQQLVAIGLIIFGVVLIAT